MGIAYKVVRPGSRASWTAIGQYQKIYSKGAIITADNETLGIFCFESYEAAKKWVEGLTIGSLLRSMV